MYEDGLRVLHPAAILLPCTLPTSMFVFISTLDDSLLAYKIFYLSFPVIVIVCMILISVVVLLVGVLVNLVAVCKESKSKLVKICIT